MLRDSNTIYNPEDIIKKEARGLGDDADFGEIQSVDPEYVITQKGIINRNFLFSKESSSRI